ncbi:MAG: phosphoribosylaminoimidazolesuccinocarboxamide synthase [Candidatus Lokiarchaeota archaeon]|nr:phosphoribosylaminoimidazolesuccinocarboxamide synthase [Candidatus Lokiarchaeota archaeon]
MGLLKKDYLIHVTNFKGSFDSFYQGKVRDNYVTKDRRVIISTDRLSAFDRIITSIPFKGQVLNMAAAFWFEKTKELVPNHVVSVPDPNVLIGKECKPLPVEMVIRGYITGSAWRAYEKDPTKTISGITFKPNLLKNQRLDEPIITPSTKAEMGAHDEEISKEEIIARKIVPREQYLEMEEYTYKLFKKGTEIAKKNGLILVDTKYEFGVDKKGNMMVIDEIHTPDSSRFWIAKSYDSLFAAKKDPEVLDKEFVRDWLRNEKNFSGDGIVPAVDEAVKVALCKKYIQNYEIVTGQKFDFNAVPEDVHPLTRIEKKLRELGYIK